MFTATIKKHIHIIFYICHIGDTLLA